MSFALRMYERFRVLIHEAAKFGVVGLAGFIVSLGGADVLHFGVGVGKYKAVVVATIAATVVTFLGNRYWAFRHRERTGMGRETVLFFVFNGIGLLIQLACVAIVQDGLGLQGKLWYNLANLCGIGLGTLFRFWSYRKWVWRTQEPAGGVPAAATARYRRPRDTRRARWPRRSRPAWTRRPRCTGAGRGVRPGGRELRRGAGLRPPGGLRRERRPRGRPLRPRDRRTTAARAATTAATGTATAPAAGTLRSADRLFCRPRRAALTRLPNLGPCPLTSSPVRRQGRRQGSSPTRPAAAGLGPGTGTLAGFVAEI